MFYQDEAKFVSQFPNVTNASGPLGFGLDGNGDMLRLFTADGRLYISICYDDTTPWPIEADGEGYTLESKSVNPNPNDATNWFAGCLGGSPGQAFDPNCGSVGTDEASILFNTLNVWPNPASDLLYYQFGSGTPVTIVLLDILGREVMLQESASGKGFFQIANLSPGIYVVEARPKKGAPSRRKVVVE